MIVMYKRCLRDRMSINKVQKYSTKHTNSQSGDPPALAYLGSLFLGSYELSPASSSEVPGGELIISRNPGTLLNNYNAGQDKRNRPQ
jgi:hypothetical protein